MESVSKDNRDPNVCCANQKGSAHICLIAERLSSGQAELARIRSALCWSMTVLSEDMESIQSAFWPIRSFSHVQDAVSGATREPHSVQRDL